MYLSTKAAPSHRVVEVEVEVVEVEVVAPGAGVPGHQVGARCSKSIHFEDGGAAPEVAQTSQSGRAL